MKSLLVIGLLLAWLPLGTFSADWKISPSGYGPIHTGMSVKQAEKLLGTRLRTSERRLLDPECDFLYPERGHEGVGFMVEAGLITHAQIMARGIPSDTGFRVGDLGSKIKKYYGHRLEIEEHKYTTGYYYFVWRQKGRSGIKYEISPDGIVQEVYGGGPTIMRVEGCS